VNSFLEEWNNDSPYVEVKTSGSTGVPKQMRVEKRRMLNSARITCDFLGLKRGDTALLCMSTDYIAGKMMVVRALERGLQLITIEPSGHPLKSTQEGLPPSIDFAAMVPLQVYNSLQVPEERDRLRHIRHLIIGGGAIDDYLQEALKDFPNAVWSTYGMTETLSHIALRRLNGPTASSWYTPFEGVKLSQTEEGCLIIDAPAVHDGLLVTNDIVELSTQQFRILGRKDNVICSGGIKIQMEEVERLLRPHLSYPYMITRAKDERLGETVVLLMEGGNTEEVKKLCEKVLPRYWQPRRFVIVDHLPLTETGKPARAEAERIVKENGTHPHG
jgi:O-succinylbenzoic acid--CoA ligase